MIFYDKTVADMHFNVLDKCIAFLESSQLPVGAVEELGDGIRCIVNAYTTIPESEAIWEAHKKFIDVHCVLEGEERIGIAHVTQGQAGNYSFEQDFLEVTAEKSAEVILKPGGILCLFPNDAHQVKLQAVSGKTTLIKKVVFKIPVELFH